MSVPCRFLASRLVPTHGRERHEQPATVLPLIYILNNSPNVVKKKDRESNVVKFYQYFPLQRLHKKPPGMATDGNGVRPRHRTKGRDLVQFYHYSGGGTKTTFGFIERGYIKQSIIKRT